MIAELVTVCPSNAFRIEAFGLAVPVAHIVKNGIGEPPGIAVAEIAYA